MQTSLEPTPHQKLRRAVEEAVIAHQADEVVRLLSVDSPLDGFGNCAAAGLEVLSGGFGAGISTVHRESFLAFCLRMDSADVVRAVIDSNLAPRAQLMRSVCSWRHATATTKSPKGAMVKSPKRLQERHKGFWVTVLEMSSVEGVHLAYDLVGDDPWLVGPTDYSVHAAAFQQARHALTEGDYWRVQAGLKLCRLFIERQAPTLVKDAPNQLMDRLVTLTPATKRDDQYLELFRLYADAGLLDPGRRLTGGAEALGLAGKLPLTAALLLRNKVAALELVRLGADTECVGDDAGMPGLGALDVLRNVLPGGARDMSEDDMQAFVAEFIEATMRATLQRGASPASQVALVSEECADGAVRAPRRRRASV